MEWTVKDTTLGGAPADPVKVEVTQTVMESFTLRATYEPIVPQGRIERIAGLRSRTHQGFLRFGMSRIIGPKQIEFEVEVEGFALEHMIEANVLATQDPVQVHFAMLPLVVVETAIIEPHLPESTIFVERDLTSRLHYVDPGDMTLGVRFQRLYEEEPARNFSVGRRSADPDRQIDEALEPADRRFPDTAAISKFKELADKTGVLIDLVGLRDNCNYRLVVGYQDFDGRLHQAVLLLTTKEPM